MISFHLVVWSPVVWRLGDGISFTEKNQRFESESEPIQTTTGILAFPTSFDSVWKRKVCLLGPLLRVTPPPHWLIFTVNWIARVPKTVTLQVRVEGSSEDLGEVQSC